MPVTQLWIERSTLVGSSCLLLAAVSACSGADDTNSTASSAAITTASRSFQCTQTTTGRITYKEAVRGTLDSASVPHDVVVTRVYTGAIEISSANPVPAPGYDSDYWKIHYGIDAWALGTDATGFKSYYFLMPPVVSGSFTALLKTDFAQGTQGNWQHWMSCSVN